MMEEHLSEPENLQTLIEAQWLKYKHAIIDNNPFEEVKIIYLRIKELQSEITEATEKIHRRLKMGD